MNSFTNNKIFFELVKVNIIDRMRAVRTITENQCYQQYHGKCGIQKQ